MKLSLRVILLSGNLISGKHYYGELCMMYFLFKGYLYTHAMEIKFYFSLILFYCFFVLNQLWKVIGLLEAKTCEMVETLQRRLGRYK